MRAKGDVRVTGTDGPSRLATRAAASMLGLHQRHNSTTGAATCALAILIWLPLAQNEENVLNIEK